MSLTFYHNITIYRSTLSIFLLIDFKYTMSFTYLIGFNYCTFISPFSFLYYFLFVIIINVFLIIHFFISLYNFSLSLLSIPMSDSYISVFLFHCFESLLFVCLFISSNNPTQSCLLVSSLLYFRIFLLQYPFLCIYFT
jgi:hypothetical protein